MPLRHWSLFPFSAVIPILSFITHQFFEALHLHLKTTVKTTTLSVFSQRSIPRPNTSFDPPENMVLPVNLQADGSIIYVGDYVTIGSVLQGRVQSIIADSDNVSSNGNLYEVTFHQAPKSFSSNGDDKDYEPEAFFWTRDAIVKISFTDRPWAHEVGAETVNDRMVDRTTAR